MKKTSLTIILIVIFGIFSNNLIGQNQFTPYDDLPGVYKNDKPAYDENYPDWAKMLYKYPVNFKEITEKFDAYRVEYPKKKNSIIRYFINWKKAVSFFVLSDGTIKLPEADSLSASQINTKRASNSKASLADVSNWTFWGPKHPINRNNVFNRPNAGDPGEWQVNVFAFDVAASNTDILFCGTQTGFVNKTIDGGDTWQLCAPNYFFASAILAVAINPSDPDIVYVSTENNKIHKTIDGGDTWTALAGASFLATRLKIDPANHNKIIAAAVEGIFVSTDAGSNWNNNHASRTWDVDFMPGNSNVVYGISESSGSHDFMISTDGGVNFTKDLNFLPSRLVRDGALIAVTPDNPNIVYASILGFDGAVERPYVYKGTNNAGVFTWVITKTGNSGTILDFFTNGQGYFDFVLEVAPDDENTVFWGTTSFYKSTDGGFNFAEIGGYNGPFSIHPDIQDIKALPGGKVWLSTDGGMSYTTDNYTNTANWTAKVQGMHGSDMWGFDQGWNDDIVVGGRFHNGNIALADTYNGDALFLGGAESPTGWIVHGRPRQAAFKDINKDRTTSIPLTIGEVVPDKLYAFPKLPNMITNNGKRRGNLVEHPNYQSVLYLGESTGFWKSNDMGKTWTLLHTFPNNVLFFDISHKNPDVLYADIQDNGFYKSEDGGLTWINKSAGILSANGNEASWFGRLHFVISPYNENTVYLCPLRVLAEINAKVLKSTDGGTTWTNWSGSLPATILTRTLAIQPTDAGVSQLYLFTDVGAVQSGNVYHRKEGMSDWETYNTNYPAGNGLIFAQPFYRDGKIRVAGNNGVWESPLAEPDFAPPYINPWIEKPVVECHTDTLYFNDHSMFKHQGASWKWTITPAPQYISNANIRNPKVVFGNLGTYDVTLEVTKNSTIYSRTLNNAISVQQCTAPEECNGADPLIKYSFDDVITNSGTVGADGDLEIDNYAGNTGSVAFAPGKYGNAYSLDGTNTLSTVNWNGVASDGTRTIAAWIKMPSLGNFIIMNMGPKVANKRYTFKVTATGKLRLEIQGIGFEGATTLNTNIWYHVAATFTGTTGTLADAVLYINGVEEATNAFANIVDTGNGVPVLVGAQAGNNVNIPVFPSTGLIDDLQVFGCALTEQEVNAIMGGNTLGFEDKFAKLDQIKAFPVPTDNTITISVPGSGEFKYHIYSIQGQLVKQGKFVKNGQLSNNLDLNLLTAGVYIIRLNDSDNRVYQIKIIKK